MTLLSPVLLKNALHHYEPWGLIQEAWAGRSASAEQEDRHLLKDVNGRGKHFASLTDAQLRATADRLRARARSGEAIEDYAVDAFGLVREASRRVLGLFHYDVQIMGGFAICRGTIAEMATGEGKTLVQSLAAFARGLEGRGVHVATANGYLAERDFEFAKPLFEFLGMTAALLPERVPTFEKRPAYEADITYGTGSEFGFDYLRDQVELMKQPPPSIGEDFRREVLGERKCNGASLCQRGLAFAIIDEIDSVLIDEASTPLVISGKGGESHPFPEIFELARGTVRGLARDEHFLIDEKASSVSLTPDGYERAHDERIGIPWPHLVRPWQTYLENALRAEFLFCRDTDYVVDQESKKVSIIDAFTGRVREGSSWKEGLHQSVEAKEGVPVTAESTSVAGISRQRFYRLYEGLGGMTGTAFDGAGEFWRFYRLSVTPIPRNRPSLAERLPARIFRNCEEKYRAIALDLRVRREKGQPILVGCRNIAESEALSAILIEESIPHTLLNAKNAKEEADLVAGAGVPGAITVATNMAGRGTHIGLSGDALKAGGLHVVATGYESSRRIDRQLTGRSARQGEPGSHQFFLSGEDELLDLQYPETAEKLRNVVPTDGDGEVDPASWEKWFERAQRKSERVRYEQRVTAFHYNEMINEAKQKLA